MKTSIRAVSYTHLRGRERLHGHHRVLHTVGIELGVGDLEVDNGVDLHGDVILRDDGLGRIVEHLLFEADLLGHTLYKRDLEVNADRPDVAERAEPLDNVGSRLLDDINVADDDDERQHRDDKYGHPFHKYIRCV